jgi:hypothetical protein
MKGKTILSLAIVLAMVIAAIPFAAVRCCAVLQMRWNNWWCRHATIPKMLQRTRPMALKQ